MPYDYKTEVQKLYSPEGLALFTEIRDRVKRLLKDAGAVTMGKAIAGSTGDSWEMLACVDHMVENGDLVEITDPANTPGQHRVFIAGRL